MQTFHWNEEERENYWRMFEILYGHFDDKSRKSNYRSSSTRQDSVCMSVTFRQARHGREINWTILVARPVYRSRRRGIRTPMRREKRPIETV